MWWKWRVDCRIRWRWIKMAGRTLGGRVFTGRWVLVSVVILWIIIRVLRNWNALKHTVSVMWMQVEGILYSRLISRFLLVVMLIRDNLDWVRSKIVFTCPQVSLSSKAWLCAAWPAESITPCSWLRSLERCGLPELMIRGSWELLLARRLPLAIKTILQMSIAQWR
jgi:hypothetical protein